MEGRRELTDGALKLIASEMPGEEYLSLCSGEVRSFLLHAEAVRIDRPPAGQFDESRITTYRPPPPPIETRIADALRYVTSDNDPEVAMQALDTLGPGQFDATLAQAAEALRQFALAAAACMEALGRMHLQAAQAEVRAAIDQALFDKPPAADAPALYETWEAMRETMLRPPLERRPAMYRSPDRPLTLGRAREYELRIAFDPDRRVELGGEYWKRMDEDIRSAFLDTVGLPCDTSAAYVAPAYSAAPPGDAQAPVPPDDEEQARANCWAALEEKVKAAARIGQISAVELGVREIGLLGRRFATAELDGVGCEVITVAGFTLQIKLATREMRAMRVY